MTILLEADAFLIDSLAPAISADTLVVADVVALRRALVDDDTHALVVIGPGRGHVRRSRLHRHRAGAAAGPGCRSRPPPPGHADAEGGPARRGP